MRVHSRTRLRGSMCARSQAAISSLLRSNAGVVRVKKVPSSSDRGVREGECNREDM